MTAPDPLREDEALTHAQREALQALHGSEWRSWPEHRLKTMMDGLGKYGLSTMRSAGLLAKEGTKYVLTAKGLAARAAIAALDQVRGK